MQGQRRSWLKSWNWRRFQYGSYASLFTLIMLAIVVLLYAIAVSYNQRFDVTRSKRFTLADQSLKLLRTLHHPIEVIGFFRLEDAQREQFKDLLRQYTHHSNKVTYELIDPDRQPALAQRYNLLSYNTIVVVGNHKEEKIFRLDEEALTNAILKVTRPAKKLVYFVTGHGEASLTDSGRNGYSLAKQGLEKQHYVVKPLVLARQAQIPEDAAVVVVAGPHTDFLAPELQALTTYLTQGGHLLLMLDPEATPGMVPFLKRYGLELGNDVVIETNALGRLFGGDYHMPAVTAYASHPITRGLDGVMTIFPVVRSVRVASELPEGISVQTLASTSPQSWAETDLKTLQEGRSSFDAGSDRQGPISIAAVVTMAPKISKTSTTASSASKPGKTPKPARLVVFGDSEFANNNFFTLQGNGDLFLNTVSWLAEEEELIALRPREGGGSGPVILTAAQQPLIFWGSVVMLPLAIFATGAVVLIRRRWQQ